MRRITHILSMILTTVMIATLVVIAGPLPEGGAGTSSLNIVVLGDSYSSGTGGLDYYGPSGCYRSRNAYAEAYASRLRQDGIDVRLTNLACHGALTSDLPAQLAQISTAERPQVDLVLMTIGGNDGGFAEIVVQCFVPLTKDGESCAQAVQKASAMMGTITQNIRSRLIEVATALPQARIVLVGYPYPLDDCHYVTGDLDGPDFPSGDQVRTLVLLLDSVNKVTVDRLNLSYGNRLRYVSVKERFVGHENCGTLDRWLRGTFDTALFNEWWHPNTEGYTQQGLYLYALGVHSGLPRPYRYLNLPLACGVSVPYASTYDYIVVGGIRYNHGYAIDLPIARGTAVVAPASGKLTARYEGSGYGYYVDIKDASGKIHRLAHLDRPSPIRSGSTVRQGQLVGYVGTSGASTGPHLHYEQRIGSSQVPMVLEGGILNWTAKLTTNGLRRTTHTLTSGNCSYAISAPVPAPAPLPSAGGVDELLFYSAANGLTIYNDVGPNGQNIEISNQILSTGWDIVTVIEIDGDGDSELLLYDREGNGARGKAQVFNVNRGGTLTLLTTLDWLNCWTHILAVDMDGDNRDELLIYSASTGYYYFHDVASNGNQTVIREGVWSSGWKIIQALEFDGSGGDELLFYRAYSSPGLALAYDLDRYGQIYEKQVFSNWLNIWTQILPIDLDGDSRDELLIYSASTGYYYLHDVLSNGAQTVIKEGVWSQGWDIITTLNADGQGPDELLFYNREAGTDRGLGLMYRTSSNGTLSELQVLSWSNFWSVIAPIEMD